MTTQTESGLPPYQLVIDGFPEGRFRVHALTGVETISDVYRFDVVVTAGPDGDDVDQAALGRRATLIFNVGAAPRAFHGVIVAARLAEVHDAGGSIKYHLRLAPRLWLLKRRQRTRIFQQMHVPQILATVLAEAGIASRFQLSRSYPPRAYCTQYEESDYRFVTRLMAEAGMFFTFAEGPPVGDAKSAASAALSAVGALGGAVGGALGQIASNAASAAAPLIPGDTVIIGDDAVFYAPIGRDDPAVLAASTAAALAPLIVEGAEGQGAASTAASAVSAAAGAVLGELSSERADVPVLHFSESPDSRISTPDHVRRFTSTARVRSNAAHFRDYDAERPMVPLDSKATSTAPFGPSAGEAVATVLDAVGDAVSAFAPVQPDVAASAAQAIEGAVSQGERLEVYDHHGPFLFPKWAHVKDEAPRILRQKRRRAVVAEGESGCPDLSPARRFVLEGHPAQHLDRAYAVTSVRHQGQTRAEAGRAFEIYAATFECVPAEVTYIPPRPRRRSVQVSLTATVVGPPGEDIHVDGMGQIKVQFHWDREGRHDDRSSCWIRTLQPWGGAGWGHQFIPRVGMEVVVLFEGGDPDKPMVLGSLYNGTHPPPFPLPRDKTKSGVRSRSTPGGHGYNELSFEDKAGAELVVLHAQRNLEERVEKNRSSHVGGGASEHVEGSAEAWIGKDLRLSVGGAREAKIGGADSLSVKGALERRAGGALRVSAGEEAQIDVRRALSIKVGGNHSIHVGGKAIESYVEGTHTLGAKERFAIRAEESISLLCGKASLVLSPDKIVIKAPTIEIEAEETLEATSKKGPSLTLGDKAEILTKQFALFTESGALEVDREFKATGQSIKLGYDPSKPTRDKDEKDPETKPFSLKLSDYFLTPYKKKKYHVTVGGARIEGETDDGGMVKCDVPADARVLQIRLWLSDYPEGPRRDYTIELEELPPPTGIEGAKARLKNLGYYEGPVDGQKTEALAAALSHFQEDHKETHGLDPTGAVDDATLGALADVHGS